LLDFQASSGGFIPTLNNQGTVDVGAGDTLTVDTYTQFDNSFLQIDIGSASSYGVLNVQGTATLAGTLEANLQNNYQPPGGSSFDVLNFASSSGQFSTVNPEGWSAEYNPTSVDLVEA
jgi:hypothetical protein